MFKINEITFINENVCCIDIIIIILTHKCVQSQRSDSLSFGQLCKSFLDHRLAALIRIFFGDCASSFTSAYFSSLSYGWKRAEFSLFCPGRFSSHSPSPSYPIRPSAVPPSSHHLHPLAHFPLFSRQTYTDDGG